MRYLFSGVENHHVYILTRADFLMVHQGFSACMVLTDAFFRYNRNALENLLISTMVLTCYSYFRPRLECVTLAGKNARRFRLMG